MIRFALDRYDTDSGLGADTFYMTNHRWAYLAPDFLVRDNRTPYSAAQDYEHRPYLENAHILPFRNNNYNNRAFGASNYDGDVRSCGMWLHTPGGYGSLGYEWWLVVGQPQTPSSGTPGRARNSSGNYSSPTAITKPVGDLLHATTVAGRVLVDGGQALGIVHLVPVVAHLIWVQYSVAISIIPHQVSYECRLKL